MLKKESGAAIARIGCPLSVVSQKIVTVDPKDYLLDREIDKTCEPSQMGKAEQAREGKKKLLASDKLLLTGGDPSKPSEDRFTKSHSTDLKCNSDEIVLVQQLSESMNEQAEMDQSGRLARDCSSWRARGVLVSTSHSSSNCRRKLVNSCDK